MKTRSILLKSLLGLFCVAWAADVSNASPLSSLFTYQGRLNTNGLPANGSYEFMFTAFDSPSGGNIMGTGDMVSAVPVSNGLFSVTVNLGAAFTGSDLWLDVSVRPTGGTTFTSLTPRQRLTATPYATYTLAAGTATLANTVAAGAISSAGLADGAMTASKIAPGAVSQLGAPDGWPANAVQVDTNGWMGIGTNAPKAALEINGGPSFLAGVVLAEVVDGMGMFTNFFGARGLAITNNLLAVAAPGDSAVSLLDAASGFSLFYSSFRDGQGSFTNLAGAQAVAFGNNSLLAVAAPNANAVTLVDVNNPAAPVWRSVMRSGFGGFSDLGGACAVAFYSNVLAIAAQTSNAVTLVNTANPAAPSQLVVMKQGSYGFTNLLSPSALAFRSNLLVIAGYASHAVTLVDVSVLGNPNPVATLNPANGYTNVYYPTALALHGTVLAIADYWYDAVTLVDVSNPASPVLLATLRNNVSGVQSMISPFGLTFLPRNGRTLLAVSARDGSSALCVFDVTDPSHPVQRGAYVNQAYPGLHYLGRPYGVVATASGNLVVAANDSSSLTLLRLSDQQAGLASDTWVGIGTTAPKAALDVVGDVLVENANRFQVVANQVELGTNTAAVGFSSIAMGRDTTASGSFSTAMGYYSTASGYASTAMGRGTVASGIYSTALGFYSTAKGDYSTAMGYVSTASGGASTALGSNTVATGAGSTAMGSGSKATNSYATAMGVGTTASGYASTALGNGNIASGNSSTALGYYTTAGGAYSLAAGYRARATNEATFVFADNSEAADFASTGTNQFLIRASGGVGINTNQLSGAALNVAGTVRATSFQGDGSGLTAVSVSPTNVASGNVAGAVNFLSSAGVGIGTSSPQGALLDVEGDIRLNDHDMYLRGGTDNNHGLGWYGVGKSFPGFSSDGPVLYGCSGGGLGTFCGTPHTTLAWDSGTVSVNGLLGATNSICTDWASVNTGTLKPGLLFGGSGSGEGISSKRTVGGNQFGLDFYTGFSPRMSIDSSGRVGIGTTAPSDCALDVRGDIRLNECQLLLRGGTDRSHGLAYVGSFAGYNVNGPLLFGTDGGVLGAKGSSNQVVLRWNNSGRVGVNTFLPNYTLHVNGTAYCSSGAWSGSDARWKKNVNSLSDSLDKVLSLRGVSYEWRREEFPEQNFEPGLQLGFIAQEVESVLPELVHTDDAGYKSVAYEKVVPVLTEAIKEQQKQLQAQQQQIDQLKAMVEALLKEPGR